MPKAGHKQFLVDVSWIWFFSIADTPLIVMMMLA